jgi:hypothetical protein
VWPKQAQPSAELAARSVRQDTVITDRRGNSATTLILTSVLATIWVTRRPLVRLCLWANPNVRFCNVRTFGDVSFDVQERSKCAICRDGTLQSRVTAGAEISSARKSVTNLVGVASSPQSIPEFYSTEHAMAMRF